MFQPCLENGGQQERFDICATSSSRHVVLKAALIQSVKTTNQKLKGHSRSQHAHTSQFLIRLDRRTRIVFAHWGVRLRCEANFSLPSVLLTDHIFEGCSVRELFTDELHTLNKYIKVCIEK